MKDYKEMFEAFLAGEILISDTNEYKLENGGLLIKAKHETVFKPYEYPMPHPENLKIKTKTININGFEVPEPTKEPLLKGTLYYVIQLSTEEKYYSLHWEDDKLDFRLLKSGIIHLTKEAAILHRDALLSFTKQGE